MKNKHTEPVREEAPETVEDVQQSASIETDKKNEKDQEISLEDKLQTELDELKDTHLRLMAEYDNYRKRTLREKADLIKSGGERALRELLPVIDDFELALAHMESEGEVGAIKEGVGLIYKKMMDYLLSMGVKPIETKDMPFDDSVAEAIALVPAPTKEQEGMIIDCTKQGYMIGDKVLRFAKVVVGQ